MSPQSQISDYCKPKYHDEEWLRRQYWDNELSGGEIGEICGVPASTIYGMMRRRGIPRRKASEANTLSVEKNPDLGFQTGRDHPQWQEHATYFIPVGRVLDGGYPAWGVWYENEWGQFRVHRLLAVAEFGIEETKGMNVHHKNGLKWDNRPENIELVDSIQHGKIEAGK